MKRHDIYYVYMIRSRHGTYYTGYTHDLNKRIQLHNNGRGAKYLKGRGPVKLVFAKEYKYYKNALKGERKIKSISKKAKEKLIESYARR